MIQSLHRIAIPAELGVSYFYFDYKNQHLQRAEQVTRCLLKQLLLQLKELPPEVDEAYDLWVKDGQKSKPDGKCLAGLLKACSTKFSKGVFIVLDALDECREYDEQEKLISIFVTCIMVGSSYSSQQDLTFSTTMISTFEKDLLACMISESVPRMMMSKAISGANQGKKLKQKSSGRM